MKQSHKDETPFRYAHAEIRTQVVVICGPTRYQLDHGGALIRRRGEKSSDYWIITLTNSLCHIHNDNLHLIKTNHCARSA